MLKRDISVTELLAPLPVFSGVGGEAIARLAVAGTAVPAAKGDVVYNRGDPCTGFYIVVYGQVKLSLQTRRGDEKVVQLVNRGEMFGEPAIFLGQPYLFTAEAVIDTKLLHIARDSVLSEVSRNALFARRMLDAMSARLTLVLEHMQGFMLRTGTQRVIHYLLAQTAESGNGADAVTLSTTKGIIASHLNITQEHFSRILRELSTAELIEVRGPVVRLLDPDGLRARVR